MIRLLTVCLLVSLVGCATSGQKTILLSENDAEEYKTPVHRRFMKSTTMVFDNNRSMFIWLKDAPYAIEVGKIMRGVEPEFRKRQVQDVRGSRQGKKKIWGVKFHMRFKELFTL